MRRSNSFGSKRSKISLMSSEFLARRKHSYASMNSFRVVGDGGSGVDVGDNRLKVSRGEAFSIVIGIVTGEFSNESSL